MTGLEKIVQQIRDEAQQAADAVIAQAKEEAGSSPRGRLRTRGRSPARSWPNRKPTCRTIWPPRDPPPNCASAARCSPAKPREIIGEAIESARQSIYKLPDSDYFALILKMISKFSLPQEGRAALLPRRPRAAARQL